MLGGAARAAPVRADIPYTLGAPMVWEFVFMMVILKIPIVYLCLVVYWAVKAEPRPPEPAPLVAHDGAPEPGEPWRPRSRPRRRPRSGPHGSPARGYARTSRVPISR
jgi:hypothetical protein